VEEAKEPEPTPPPSPTPTPQPPVQSPPQPVNREGRRQRRRSKSGLKLGDSLSSMTAVIEEKKAELKELQGPEETRVYEKDASIHIDEKELTQALESYAKILEGQNKMNLASIIREGTSELEHNYWSFKVDSELQRDMLAREPEMLSFLREQLQQPELFGDIVVDTKNSDSQKHTPYTDEEKLREMAQNNPNLASLQEIFKTRIIYK